MLGYSKDQKAYRLFELKTGKVICRRDVQFFEADEKPSKSQNIPQPIIQPKSYAYFPPYESSDEQSDNNETRESCDEGDQTVIQNESADASFKSLPEQNSHMQSSTPNIKRPTYTFSGIQVQRFSGSNAQKDPT